MLHKKIILLLLIEPRRTISTSLDNSSLPDKNLWILRRSLRKSENENIHRVEFEGFFEYLNN